MKRVIFLTVLFIILFTYLSFGADAMYRLMHNDHDTLIIGEIKSISDSGIQVDVSKTIVSSRDLNKNNVKRQLKPKTITIEKISGYIFNYNKQSNTYPAPKVGDYIMASLNKEQSGKYKVAWGCFKVSGLDYKTLDILIQDKSSEYEKMDATAIKSFINSSGKNTEFAFDGNENIVYLNKNGDRQIIYKGLVKHTISITPTKIDVSVTATSVGISQNKITYFLVGFGFILVIAVIIIYSKRKKIG